MRRILSLIGIEFRREFSSPVSLVFFLALPLLFTAIIGTALGAMVDGETSAEDTGTPLAVVCGDPGRTSDVLWAALERADLAPRCVESLAADEFGLLIPADFSARLLAGQPLTLTLQLQSNDSSSPVVEQAVRAAVDELQSAVQVARLSSDQALARGLLADQAQADDLADAVLAQAWADAATPAATVQVAWADDQPATAQSMFITPPEQASAGQIVTWVQITLLGAAEVLVDERMRGTLRRLLVMPSSRGLILGGKLLGRLILGLTQMVLLVGGGALLFGVPWGRSPLAAAGVSLAFALSTVALGGLLATFMRTRGQVSATVTALSMGLAALGGAWYPLQVTPPLYQKLAQFLPSTWAMKGYNAVFTQSAATGPWAGLWAVLPEIGVILGFAVLFAGLAAWRLRRFD